MCRRTIIKNKIIILLLFILSISNINAKDKKNSKLDSILTNLSSNAYLLQQNSPNYEAELYIKGTLSIIKRNILLKTIPYCNQIPKNKDFYFIETWGSLLYTAPDKYSQTIKHFNSNHKAIKQYLENVVLPHIQGNVYSSYLYNVIYSPLSAKAKKYYNYSIDTSWNNNQDQFYKINFYPNISNYQLAKGYMIINRNNWSIREIFIRGKNEFFSFSNHIIMGEIGTEYEFLPINNSIDVNLKYFGNKIFGSYITFIKYKNVFTAEQHDSKENKPSKYDLTIQFNTLFKNENIDTIRPIPLTKIEETVLSSSKVSKLEDTTANKFDLKDFGKFITTKKSFDFNTAGKLEISPIISPIVFNYSSSNGIAYAQKVKYTNFIGDNKILYLEPYIGYNFKYKEFFTSLKGKYEFSKRRSAAIVFDGGTGHTINTDRIKKDLNNIPDTIFNPQGLNLEKFRQTYGKIGYKMEISNGLNITALLGINKLKEINQSDLTVINPNSEYVNKAKSIAKHAYYSFVPEFNIEWTPGLYYYRVENRKFPLYSKFPTFALNWAFAVKGVFQNSTTYHRIEFDMQQVIKLNLSQRVGYRFGIGGFINYTELYFTDFLNFKRNILPIGWNDEMGGVFQLLSGFQYNEITKYIRGNVMFETPFLIIPSLFKNLPYIMKERLYFNVLLVETMKPYFEIGYGIGTQIFNAGIFWGGESNKFNKIGVKFTFELFNY